MSYNIGYDTETTGIYIKHGCRPFYFATWDNHDVKQSWQWRIDRHTRMPIIGDKERREKRDIEDRLHAADKVILWNAKFDVRASQSVGIRMPSWDKIYDASTELHVLDPYEMHALRMSLKPTASRFMGIPQDDQKRLHQICLRARNIAKKLGWAVADGNHPHFKPARGRSPKEGWVVCDMWIPREIALLDNWRDYLSLEERDEWLSVCGTYGDNDAYRTVVLHEIFWPEIVEQKLVKQFKLQQAVFSPLYAIEEHGFPMLPKKLKAQKERMRSIAEHHEKKAQEAAEADFGGTINIRSNPQLNNLLYNIWELPILKETKTGGSTDFETLIKLAFIPEHRQHLPKTKRQIVKDFLLNVLHYGKVNTAYKYLNNYDSFRIKNLLYGNTKPQGTKTTRISFGDPNLQNIGKGGAEYSGEDPEVRLFYDELKSDNDSLRCVFGPEEGTFWYDIDYSQLQLRIFAYVAGEQSLMDAFDAGWDAHTYVARRIFGLRDDETPSKLQRRIAKAVNFGFIFGAQPAKIERTAGRPGLWDEVIAIFPFAHQYMQTIQRQVRKHGFVYTPGGYRLTCDRAHKGVNYIVQGSEGEIVKRAMVETHRYVTQLRQAEKAATQHLQARRTNARLRLQVHDELIFSFLLSSNSFTMKPYLEDGKEKIGIILKDYTHINTLKRIMEDAGSFYGIKTPVEPEIVTESWDKSYKVFARTKSKLILSA